MERAITPNDLGVSLAETILAAQREWHESGVAHRNTVEIHFKGSKKNEGNLAAAIETIARTAYMLLRQPVTPPDFRAGANQFSNRQWIIGCVDETNTSHRKKPPKKAKPNPILTLDLNDPRNRVVFV